ncbi:MAG: long-chain fatty acid--CoA ligase [Deltaproteobacteria bacterium]|uniref:Long-chain fatty acid--CoA ligase n=1 Tax=Candidatus Zymogenus saltonus TaxID=2844893 RepID=A0A9D8KHB4_9DELT|nr:long-chain fatty acid--CoA ligase [Candidatus Zymogenus saltonus]
MAEKVWHKFYPPNVPKNIDYDKHTISQALKRSAEKYPNQSAINYMGRKITYKELDGLVNSFARALIDMGVKKGDNVAVCLPNIPQVVIADLAIMRIGAVIAQNNPLYTERELEYQLNDSGSEYIITLSLLVPRMQGLMPKTKIKKIIACHIHSYLSFPKKQLFPYVKKAMHRDIEETDDVKVFINLIKKYSKEPIEDKSKWDDLATLIYTGGTTGVSKGVMLSHKNLSVNVQQIQRWFPDLTFGDDSIVGTYPLFHSAGNIISCFAVWMGWTQILIPRPEPKGIVEILKKTKPGWLPGVPTIFVGLLNEPSFRSLDLTFIKGFFSAAAPLAPETLRDLKDLTGATMSEIYGMTEVSPAATITPSSGTIKPGTVGIPIADTDVKVMDSDKGTKELKPHETGEIIITGPQLMMGYYNKPKETKEAVRNGWFYSGDLGFFDEDGYLTIVDRKKDMVIAGGYNIYPVEIDNVLYEHPKILEACAAGVPDKYRGETIKAFVVVKPGEKLTEEEVIAYCKKNLAAYKVPKVVEFMNELPKSTVGKVLRRELRDMEMKKAKEAGK